MANSLTILLELFPNKCWRWESISGNSNINWDYIMSHRSKFWSLPHLSANSSAVTWETVKNNPNARLIFEGHNYYFQNHNNKQAYMKYENINGANWNYLWLSVNTNITWEIVQEVNRARQMKKIQEINSVKREINMTDDLTEHKVDDLIKHKADNLTEHKEIIVHKEGAKINDGQNTMKSNNGQNTMDIINIQKIIDIDNNIENSSERNWDWSELSQNTSVATLEIVKANPRKIIGGEIMGANWDWNYICRNPKVITKEIISNAQVVNGYCESVFDVNYYDNFTSDSDWIKMDYFADVNIPVDWGGLSCNPNITWEFVLKFHDKCWNWYSLSQNIAITWEIIEGNQHSPWDEIGVSLNPNITWEIVQSNKAFRWNWNFLCHNPSIFTYEVIQNQLSTFNGVHIDFTGLSLNPNLDWEIVSDNPELPWQWESMSQNEFLYNKIARDMFDNRKKSWRKMLDLHSSYLPRVLINIVVDYLFILF